MYAVDIYGLCAVFVSFSMEDEYQKRKEAIGAKLKKMRIDAGYTSYVDFAIKNNLDSKQTWRLEEGQANFTITSLLRVLDIHKVSLEDFFKGL
ncbi:MAG: XRE family transcriptional regulator [Cyclobacteriaceae bacterium]